MDRSISRSVKTVVTEYRNKSNGPSRPNARTTVILSIIALYNTAILALTFTAAATMHYAYGPFANSYWQNKSLGTRLAAIFFFFCTIPIMVCALSYWDLYNRWTHSLRSMRIVVNAAFGLAAFGLCEGLWTPCIYSSRTWVYGAFSEGAPQWNITPKWCPMGTRAGPLWPFHNGGRLPELPNVGYLLPWSLILTEIFYALYLIFGIVALRKESSWPVPEDPETKPIVETMQFAEVPELSEGGQQFPELPGGLHPRNSCAQDIPKYHSHHVVAMSYATPQDVVPEIMPSTLRSSIGSNVPTRALSTINSVSTLPTYEESELREMRNQSSIE